MAFSELDFSFRPRCFTSFETLTVCQMSGPLTQNNKNSKESVRKNEFDV